MIESPTGQAQFTKRGDVDELVPGLVAFRNPNNKFVILELHYSADPGKRSAAWKQMESIGVTASDWAREMSSRGLSGLDARCTTIYSTGRGICSGRVHFAGT